MMKLLLLAVVGLATFALCNAGALRCPKPVAPPNAYFNASTNTYYNPGDSVKFVCKSGFELQGAGQVVCQKTESWVTYGKCNSCINPCRNAVCLAYPTAICERHGCEAVHKVNDVFVDCNSYCKYKDSNGQEQVVPVGSTLDYTLSCSPGYIVDGDTRLTCDSHDTWSGKVPECKLSYLDAATCNANCYNRPCKNSVCKAAQDATCYCDECKPVYLRGGAIVECNKYCTVPRPDGFKGDLDFDTIPVGSTIDYQVTCSVGYKITGSNNLRCLSHEVLSAEIPKCIRIPNYCPYQVGRKVKYGTITGGKGPIYLGHTLKISCDIGYRLIGSASLVCQQDRKWSAKYPRCRPKCRNLQKCLVNPCDTAICNGDPTAICRPNYCGGCNAEWYRADGTKVSDKICETPLCRLLCPDNACDKYKCIGVLAKECVPDTCNACKPLFYNRYGKRIPDTKCKKICARCPVKRNCLCPRYPNSAVCVDNSDCRYCEPEFLRNGQRLTLADCQATTCPANKPRVTCAVDPCKTAKCPNYPEATCVPDYCGECSARYYLNDEPVSCEGDCPVALSKCKINPCDISSCRGRPGAVCIPNYCGGCKAEWYYEGKKATDKMCEKPLCRLGCPPIVCGGMRCSGYTDIDCLPDTCNRCNPLLYDKYGNRIPDRLCSKGYCTYTTGSGEEQTILVGGVVDYTISCPPNYIVDGDTRVTCIEHETWSGKKPVCKKAPTTDCSECGRNHCLGKKCGASRAAKCYCVNCKPVFLLDDITLDCDNYCPYISVNGEEKALPVGSNLQYSITCAPGKYLVGHRIRECISHNTWSGPPPRCVEP